MQFSCQPFWISQWAPYSCIPFILIAHLFHQSECGSHYVYLLSHPFILYIIFQDKKLMQATTPERIEPQKRVTQHAKKCVRLLLLNVIVPSLPRGWTAVFDWQSTCALQLSTIIPTSLTLRPAAPPVTGADSVPE